MELTPLTRVRAAVGRYTQSPGYEKLLQADYFVDLTASTSQSLSSERSTHVLAALEHTFAPGLTGRIEGYYKHFDQMIVGRLETPDETAARVAQYNFPVALQSNVPTDPIITSFPVNGATGKAYGVDVYIEKKAMSASDRLSGWASYTFGRALIDAYGREYPFDYDRRHALSIVGTFGVSRRLDLSATWRVASGFPNTPPIGVRVAPTLAPGAVDGAPGSLIPLRDAGDALVWTVDNGSVANLNSGNYPTYARLDVRVTFKPRSANGRWQVYVEMLNALDRKNVTTLQPQLDFDATSDRPTVSTSSDAGLPRLPSFGVRYRF